MIHLEYVPIFGKIVNLNHCAQTTVEIRESSCDPLGDRDRGPAKKRYTTRSTTPLNEGERSRTQRLSVHRVHNNMEGSEAAMGQSLPESHDGTLDGTSGTDAPNRDGDAGGPPRDAKPTRLQYTLNTEDGRNRVLEVCNGMCDKRIHHPKNGMLTAFHHGGMKKVATEVAIDINNNGSLNGDGDLLFPTSQSMTADKCENVWRKHLECAEVFVKSRHLQQPNGGTVAGHDPRIADLYDKMMRHKNIVEGQVQVRPAGACMPLLTTCARTHTHSRQLLFCAEHVHFSTVWESDMPVPHCCGVELEHPIVIRDSSFPRDGTEHPTALHS